MSHDIEDNHFDHTPRDHSHTSNVIPFPIIPRPIQDRETFGRRQPQALNFCWLVVSLMDGSKLAIPHVLGHMSKTYQTMRQTILTLPDVIQVSTSYDRPNASSDPVSIGPYVGFRLH